MRSGAFAWIVGMLVVGGAAALAVQATKSPDVRQAQEAMAQPKVEADPEARQDPIEADPDQEAASLEAEARAQQEDMNAQLNRTETNLTMPAETGERAHDVSPAPYSSP